MIHSFQRTVLAILLISISITEKNKTQVNFCVCPVVNFTQNEISLY